MVEAGLPATWPLQIVVDLALPDTVAVVAVPGMSRIVLSTVSTADQTLAGVVVAARIARHARIGKESGPRQRFQQIGMLYLIY